MRDLTKEEIYWEADFTKVGTCECCEEKEGYWAINPFDAEIMGEENWMYLCQECHQGFEMDI